MSTTAALSDRMRHSNDALSVSPRHTQGSGVGVKVGVEVGVEVGVNVLVGVRVGVGVLVGGNPSIGQVPS